ISGDVLESIIRRLSQDEVISTKTDSISAKPDQASLHGPTPQVSLNSFSKHSHYIHFFALVLSIYGGARCYVGVSLDRGNAGLRMGSRRLSEGTDWGFQHTLVNLILSAQSIGGEPSPSTMAIILRPSRIDLCRDHLGSVSAESDSATAETTKNEPYHPSNKAIAKKDESDHPGRVTKLLAVGIIYPISDSQSISQVQVVPKKSRMTVMKNQHDELVPMQIHYSWRVCIDYRKLNQVTRKDHFPLPFIDQVLEKLAGKSHYCFLDGFSGYM
ncbi:Retrovirus-related Pol polyprotein, partial [Mucuna pruriens]